MLCINATIAAISFVPMKFVADRLFHAATNSNNTFFFPQRMNNPVMLWAVLNGLSSIVIFVISFIVCKHIKERLANRQTGSAVSGAETKETFVSDDIRKGNKNTFKILFSSVSLLTGFLFVMTMYYSNLPGGLLAGLLGLCYILIKGRLIHKRYEDKRKGFIEAGIACAVFVVGSLIALVLGGFFPFSEVFDVFLFLFTGVILLEAGAYWISRKKFNIDHWGLKIQPFQLFKIFLMTLAIVSSFYFLQSIIYFFLHVDFRFLFVLGVRPMNTDVVWMVLMMVPFYFVFYMSNSIRVNGNIFEKGQKEWMNLLLSGFANIFGLLIILGIQYTVLLNTGEVFWQDTGRGIADWLMINILYGLIPVMFLLPLFNRWFYQISGRSWLGPMVMCFLFIAIALNNSVAYIPLP